MSYTAHLQSTNTKLIFKGYFSGIDETLLLNKIKNNATEYEIPTYSKSAYSEKIKENTVLFWHKYALKIAADYNRPVKSKDGKTYPVADRANPYQYPKFPYASPPYTARMLAYLSVTLHDVHLFIEQNVNSLQIIQKSKGTEIAMDVAASKLLVYFFPCETENIEKELVRKLSSNKIEDKNAYLVGLVFANEIISKAKLDNFENNNDLIVEKYVYPKSANFESWTSLDNPSRPPLLPKFGLVKTWHLNAENIESVRPSPPPIIGSEQFMKDLYELKSYIKSMTRAQTEIANFWADGPGSPTPPGHWNTIVMELMAQKKMDQKTQLEIFAMLNTALMDAAVCCWQTKYYYDYPRPNQIDPSIKTILGVPNFPSYTSGHSTFSGAAAKVLSAYFKNEQPLLEKYAKNASESRIYGCIHYRFDCEAGLECGKKIGEIVLLKMKK